MSADRFEDMVQPDWRNVGCRRRLSPSHQKAFAFWMPRLLLVCAAIAVARDVADFLRQRAEERREARLAAEVLPDGVERAWLTFVEDQIQQKLSRYGNLLRIADGSDEYDHRTVYMSLAIPFVVSCDPIIGEVVFNGGVEGAIEVPIYGLGASADEPPLPVDRYSAAARRLFDRLCASIARRVDSIRGGE